MLLAVAVIVAAAAGAREARVRYFVSAQRCMRRPGRVAGCTWTLRADTKRSRAHEQQVRAGRPRRSAGADGQRRLPSMLKCISST